MNGDLAVLVFESLASRTRLDVFKLLVRAAPDGCVAGDIAFKLAIPANNLSFHLKAMTHAQLLTSEQEGRFVRYRANLALMAGLIDYLTDECCQGSAAGSCLPMRVEKPC